MLTLLYDKGINTKLSQTIFSRKSTSRDLSKIILLHPTYYPKDLSCKILHNIFTSTYKDVFKHPLGIDNLMIAYHIPDNLRKLVMLNNLKECNEIMN